MPTQDELRDLMPSIEVTEEELKRRKELEQKCDSLIAKIRGLEKTEIETLTEENRDLRAQLAAQERVREQMVKLSKSVAPKCEPEETLEGIYWQIDNYIAGTNQRIAAQEQEMAGLRERLGEAEGLLRRFCSFTLLPAHLPTFKEIYDKAQAFLAPAAPGPELHRVIEGDNHYKDYIIRDMPIYTGPRRR